MSVPSALPAVVEGQEYPEVRSPMDMTTESFRAGLQRRGDNRKLLMDWIKTSMVEGTDFGKIHVVGKNSCAEAKAGRAKDCKNEYHWSKPVLFQPGAQKICGMLGVFVTFPSLYKYEEAALSGVDLKHVIIRCEIRDSSGTLVGDGVGARSLEQDYGDLNKSLKMSCKSGHVAATLRMAGLSEVFTQDLEDMQDGKSQKLAEERKSRIDQYARKFLDALDSDIPEEQIAGALFKVHEEVNACGADLYNEVWRTLSSKDRSTIKQYINKARSQGTDQFLKDYGEGEREVHR